MAHSAPAPRLVIVGSSNTDLILSCPRLPRPGETLLGGEFQRFFGGKGANQAVAAARAGAKVTFIGARGDDDFGQAAATALKKEGIDLRHFRVRKKIPSGIALILLGADQGENLIAVARSANDTVSARDISLAFPAIRHARAVVAQLEVPLATVTAAAKLAQQAKVPFILNPAPARPLPATLLKLVHTLVPNEHEAALLTGEKKPEWAGVRLLQSGCRQVVITLGAKGALLVDPNGSRSFAAPKVKPRDTVGAGDCFTGWLATGIAEGLPIEKAIQRALRAASLSVTRPGAQSGMPYRREIVRE
ncbi:MAG: ribokinase [Methylacidiphilales bacterium]|nr:ribokinase [Candidatus Methylacidiphilales bacterium]